MEKNKAWKYIVMALGIGWEISGILILSVFIGVFIDKVFVCSPIGIILGSIIGIIGSFIQILKLGDK